MQIRTLVLLVGICTLSVGILVGVLIGHFSRTDPTGDSNHETRSAVEAIADRVINEINRERIRENLRYYARKPHLAGTAADREGAEDIRQTWLDQGLDSAKLVPYKVYLQYPPSSDDEELANKVQIINPSNGEVIFTSALRADPFNEDELLQPGIPPPYSAYSATGDVMGDLVYVNYGREEDYETILDELDPTINFTGKIAIIRQGASLRYDKAAIAHRYGIIGVILYSDPKDYSVPEEKGLPYPHGKFLPGSATQRGALLRGVGDPLTHGYPAKDYAFRVSPNETDIPRIPVHPVGFHDAEILLQAIGGATPPNYWIGSLNINYTLGPGFIGANKGNKVRLVVNSVSGLHTTYNTVGFIRGEIEPDRYVVLGNHRDAWGLGSIDPTSGTATLLEISRAFGKLKKQGWRPRRTLMFCSFGAEEFGMFGSVEWTEEFHGILSDRTVAYLNLDIAVAEHEQCRLRGLEDVVDENRTLTRLRDSLVNHMCQEYGPRIEDLKTNFDDHVNEMRKKVNLAFKEAIKTNKDREEKDAAKISREIEEKNRKLRDDIRKTEMEIERNNEEMVTRLSENHTISQDKQSAINNEQTELLVSIRNIAEQIGQKIVDLEKSWKELTKSHEDATRLDDTASDDGKRLVKEEQRVEDSVSAIFVKQFDDGELDRIDLMASHGWFVKAEGRARHLGETEYSQGWNCVQSVKVTDQIYHPVIVGYSGNGDVIMTDTSEWSKDTYTFNMASKHIQRVICGSHASYVVSCALLKDNKIACGRYVARPKCSTETGYISVYDSEWNLVTKVRKPWYKKKSSKRVFVAANPDGMIVACELGQKMIYVINPVSGEIINSIEGMDTMALRGMQSSGHIVAQTSPSDRRVFLIKAGTPEDEFKHRDVILNVGIDPATDDLYTVTSEGNCLTCVIWKLNRDYGDDIDADDANRMAFPLCDRLIELGNTRASIKARRDHLETSLVILVASNKLIACDGENILVYLK